MQPVGIMAALYDEIASLLHAMGQTAQVHRIGQRDYYVGTLYGLSCVVVLARIGKVAAAATAVTLIREFGVGTIVFTGLAGALSPQVKVGDIVVATSLLQHDLDVTPLFPRHEVPLLGCSHFAADARLVERLHASTTDYLTQQFSHDVPQHSRRRFNVSAPQLHCGLIVSGDQFVSDAQTAHTLRNALPGALCVEMEGAALAQIGYEYGVPFAVVRTISDRADAAASVDFSAFLQQVARFYSAGILQRFLAATAASLPS